MQIEPVQRKLKLTAHKRYTLKCKFSPDSTLLATTSADQTAKIWRTADLLPLSERPENEGGMPNGVLNSNWPMAENISPLSTLTTSNQRWVWDVAFSGDSQYVITGEHCLFKIIFKKNYLISFFYSIFRWRCSIVERDYCRNSTRIYWSSKTFNCIGVFRCTN